MTPRIRPLFHMLFCLLLQVAVVVYGAAPGGALTPAAMAPAVSGPLTAMVICGDGGARTVFLDAQGNPAEPGSCCDCLKCLTFSADLPIVPPAGMSLRRIMAAGTAPDAAPPLAVAPCLHPLPRGPPCCVMPRAPAAADGAGAEGRSLIFGVLEVHQEHLRRIMRGHGPIPEVSP